MPILIKNGSDSEVVPMCAFSNEEELELLLAHPELLGEEEESIAFVARQIHLSAGELDLLFVNSDGLPIAVETKMKKNPEARREVIGQVIDYMASLTDLTVDELDQRVGGKLRDAIENLTEETEAEEAGEAEESDFDRVWQAVGTNLRAGQARLVVALDEAPPSLERIFRFLARNSRLDVRLVTVQKYASKLGDVFVPRTIVNPPLERDSNPSPPSPPDPLFLAVINAYDSLAPAHLRTTGKSPDARYVRPAGWPRGIDYSFWKPRQNDIVVQLEFPKKWRESMADCLAGFDDQEVADNVKLSLHPKNKPKKCKLLAELPIALPPEKIARAMLELIDLTKDRVSSRVNQP